MAHPPHLFPPRHASGLRRALLLLSAALLAAGPCRAQPSASPSSSPSTPNAKPAMTTPAQHMIAEIQVIPRPAGTEQDRYRHVDAAIAVIQASGLKYEVHGLGTVVEGPPEKVWPLLQAVHQATLESGAERTLSVIKVSSGAAAGGPTVADLVGKFRR